MDADFVSTSVTFDGETFVLVPEPNEGQGSCEGCSFFFANDVGNRCSTSPECTGGVFVPKSECVTDVLGGRTDSGACRNSGMLLSRDPAVRKATPITTGVLDYFPRALAAVAQCSKAGNDQHNLGQPLHWAREKSTDHADCIARHLIDRNAVDSDGIRHAAKLAWRALALLETLLESEVAE